MILTCKQCETRFKLDATLLNPGGSKVRCSQCKYVFTVYPDKPSTEPDLLEEIFEGSNTFDEHTEPSQKKENATNMGNSQAPELSEPAQKIQEELPEFSKYEAILDKTTQPESILSKTDIKIQDNKSIPRVEKKAEPPPGFIPTPHQPRFKAKPAKRKKTAKKFSVMLLVIVFLVTACAYIASLFLGYKIPWLPQTQIPIIDKLIPKKTEQKDIELSPSVIQADLSSKFVSNENAGELFIITGLVKNPSNIAYQHIQVKGTLLGKNEARVVTKRAFCGNIVSQEILETGLLNEINNILATKIGMNGNNTNLTPNATVPFMIVFSDLTENLSNFTVEVEGFEKVDAK